MQSFKYFADGRIKSKSGVGTGDYVYPQPGAGVIQPHAVKSIPGVPGEFSYDLNGNRTTGNGYEVTWTSFDMPKTIKRNGKSSAFVYGSEHQRTVQSRSDGTTVIYAGAQEVETVTLDGKLSTTVKTYWPFGVGVEIEQAAQTKLYWTHTDRLGSVVAMTRLDGTLAEKLAYDAWGKRRMLTNQATPDSVSGEVDNKGYTGHEMLDQLDLVHMNGRVYDPFVAQFLSGDLLIADPSNGQNYNRYSYVLNNPTNLVDPTGFAAEGEETPAPPQVVVEGESDKTKSGFSLGSFRYGISTVIFDGAKAGELAAIATVSGYFGSRVGGLPPTVRLGSPNTAAAAAAGATAVAGRLQMAGAGGVAVPGGVGGGEALAGATAGLGGAAALIATATISGSEARAEDRYIYVTYTRTRVDPVTGEIQVYSGRTSGVGEPQELATQRGRQQDHLNKEGFGPPVVDRWSESKVPIRGREQQLIDFYGGAKSVGGSARNMINGVADFNPLRPIYIGAAISAFGPLIDNSPNRPRLGP
ncbi:RHS repeat domain-containing protein [Massilia sp. Root351]|uniref:RHS repeat domain-containing protein n=1 Tax=Massilia sp. Root351 TaxID=1736522 RepID=UPI0009E99617|nr:RHS repeat-associated core domain-containing protein [Massilia sp. Root351]